MNFARVRVRNFRNHSDSSLELGCRTNVLVGGNGEGKTNLLEAISYFGLTKSFFAANDATTLQRGKNRFEIEGNIIDSNSVSHDVQVIFDQERSEKTISVNRAPLDRLNQLIGQFPVVVLSPESSRITSGSPSERRKFVDMVLAQESRSYLEDLLEYRRVLRQRNRLLLEARAGRRTTGETLSPWTENLAKLGGRIILRRKNFVDGFKDVLTATHKRLSGNDEEPEIRYRTMHQVAESDKAEDISAELMRALDRSSEDECRRGTTLVGPHRDDLPMMIDGFSVPEHASQGQHKTLLLAMKIAEFDHLARTIGEQPVLLLDDLFGELDQERSREIIELVSELGQSIITTTNDRLFIEQFTANSDNRRLCVENGTCRPA